MNDRAGSFPAAAQAAPDPRDATGPGGVPGARDPRTGDAAGAGAGPGPEAGTADGGPELGTLTDGPPSDYRLAVPDGWERVVLDPDRWGPRIDRLVARQFRGIDDQPHLRRQIADEMKDRAAAAHANGGVEMYLSLAEVGGVPLPAGLVVTVVAPEPGGTLPDLDAIGIARGAEGADVGMLDLPAGPALRHRYREVPAPVPPGEPPSASGGRILGSTMPVTHLDFEIAIPNSPLHLLLSFSTSMDPLADVLVELFDTIATTLQWMA